jgi:hypothetical protein
MKPELHVNRFNTMFAFFFFVLMTGIVTGQNALHFDGIDDHVILSNGSAQIANATGISLSVWVYPTNAGSAWPDFDGFGGFRNDANADFYLCQLSSTNVEARFRNSSGTTFDINSATLVLNTWQHFLLTYNGTQLSLYRNGVLLNSVPATGTITNATVPLYIGKLVYSVNNFNYLGKIDEFGLWARALSAAEVAALYSGVVNTADPQLKLYYKFDQGVANGNNVGVNTLIDSKGNGNGMLMNFALTGTTSNWVDGLLLAIPADAGLQGITHPADSVCAGSQPVRVILKNWGPNPMATVKIDWKVNGNLQPQYTWVGNLPANAQDTVLIGNYPFHPDTTYSITAWTSMPNAMADTANANDTLTKGSIFVKPMPQITGLSSTYNICQGDTAFLTGTLSGTPPWSVTITQGAQSQTITGITSPAFILPLNPSVTTAYTLQNLTDAGGCPNTTPIAIQVVVSQAPPATITPGGTQAFCSGDSLVLQASVGLNFAYQWLKNGVTIPGATNYVYGVKSSGAYTVKVTSPIGCSAISSPVQVTAHPAPAVFIGNDTTVGAGVSLFLNAGLGYTGYLWSTGATTNSIVVDSAGSGLGTKTFWVGVTDNYGCKGFDTIRITFATNPGLIEHQKNDGFILYPNPASNQLVIESRDVPLDDAVIRFFTPTGVEVSGGVKVAACCQEMRNIDLIGLSAGIYQIVISRRNGETIYTNRVVICR